MSRATITTKHNKTVKHTLYLSCLLWLRTPATQHETTQCGATRAASCSPREVATLTNQSVLRHNYHSELAHRVMSHATDRPIHQGRDEGRPLLAEPVLRASRPTRATKLPPSIGIRLATNKRIKKGTALLAWVRVRINGRTCISNVFQCTFVINKIN